MDNLGDLFNHTFHAVSRKRGRKKLQIGDLIKTAEDHRWLDMPIEQQ